MFSSLSNGGAVAFFPYRRDISLISRGVVLKQQMTVGDVVVVT
jgi:hypothetical protein